MKYLFFDIECADGGKATICSFGYVIADEKFKILRREDIVINPQGRFFLTGRAGRPDVQLAYPIETFKRAPSFDRFYNKIKALVENKEYFVVGHSIGDDVTYLNKACARYNLEPFCFEYFDTQRMYRELTGDKKSISLENAIATFDIKEKFRYHQSVEDARATMLLLKTLLEKANMSFEDYRTIDHAAFSSKLLFEQGLIKEFVTTRKYDHLIKVAIEQHNKYQVTGNFNERELLFIYLIRDSDKLDNFRVKETETLETLLNVSKEQLELEKISDSVYKQYVNCQLIYSPSRQTNLDKWLSYIAFIFDLHFDVSKKYIKENNYINRLFNRITPVDELTAKKYQELKQLSLKYIEE